MRVKRWCQRLGLVAGAVLLMGLPAVPVQAQVGAGDEPVSDGAVIEDPVVASNGTPPACREDAGDCRPGDDQPCQAGRGALWQDCDPGKVRLRSFSSSGPALVAQFGAPPQHLLQVLEAPGQHMAQGQCGQGVVDLPLVRSYCLPGIDQTNHWMSQGITGEGESGWGDVAGRNITIISAYYSKKNSARHEDSRISVIDNDSRSMVTVGLVEPKAGKHAGCSYQQGVSLCPFKSHAGGLAWAGRYLYMAGGSRLHVFDLTQFIPMGDDYVLPEMTRYTVSGPNQFMMAYISVDVSRRELLAGRYIDTSSGERIAHWPLENDGRLASLQSSFAVRTQGRQTSIRLQGGAAYGGLYFLSQSGSLQTGEKDHLYIIPLQGQAETHPWLYGAEDLYIDPQRDLLWGPGEVAHKRSIVAVDISDYL